MGNSSGSPKDTSANTTPRTAADLDLLPLRERFEELAGPPPALDSSSGVDDPGQAQERFVLFDDCSKLVGPRGAHVATRLYGVLDADRDGKLNFEEFSSAACLLKGSPDEDKLALLFKMYGVGNGGGFSVGREGLQAFILDIIAASPSPLAPIPLPFPLDHGDNFGGEKLRRSPLVPLPQRGSHGRGGGGGEGGVVGVPDFEVELKSVLVKMADVVLAEYDADGDGMLTEKDWRAYLKREEDSVGAFLEALSDSVGELLLP